MTDKRTKEYRDSEILANLDSITHAWLDANRNRRPALYRLLAAGRIRECADSDREGVLKFEIVPPPKPASWFSKWCRVIEAIFPGASV